MEEEEAKGFLKTSLAPSIDRPTDSERQREGKGETGGGGGGGREWRRWQ